MVMLNVIFNLSIASFLYSNYHILLLELMACKHPAPFVMQHLIIKPRLTMLLSSVCCLQQKLPVIFQLYKTVFYSYCSHNIILQIQVMNIFFLDYKKASESVNFKRLWDLLLDPGILQFTKPL